MAKLCLIEPQDEVLLFIFAEDIVNKQIPSYIMRMLKSKFQTFLIL